MKVSWNTNLVETEELTRGVGSKRIEVAVIVRGSDSLGSFGRADLDALRLARGIDVVERRRGSALGGVVTKLGATLAAAVEPVHA